MGACLLLVSTATAQTVVPTSPGTGLAPAGVAPREDTYETARGLGMGMGGRASATGINAVAYNPANLPLAPLYHLEGYTAYFPASGTLSFGSAVADSITNRLAAGISARAIFGGADGDDESQNYRGYDGRLSLGFPLSERIAIGLSGRYMQFRSRARNAAGESVGSTNLRAFTLDAAARVTPVEGLHVSAMGYNVIRTDSPLAPLQLGGGVSYTIREMVTLAGDAFADLTTFDKTRLLFGVGAEVLLGEKVPLRLGYRRDDGRGLDQITAALGYVDRQLGVDLALRQDIGGGGPRRSELLFSFRYHVQ
ncbi:MAG: hypothetical protein AAF447_15020 [Myxococcota bacterium]